MIPYGKQSITQNDINAVIEVLNSDFLTQGPKVPLFEASLVKQCGADHAVVVNSATSALHVACMALGLGAGDWLWTSPITFVASANVALYCGAKVDFVDIDASTYNMCPKKLKNKLQLAKAADRLPKILIPVHMCGQPCEMQEIKNLCDEYSVRIIEDASHAIGAMYHDEPVGSCKFSDITVFSFHPVKIVTTAEGGAALTNSSLLAEKMQLHRSHGVTREQAKMESISHGAWYYEQIDLGYNYRMTELQAALGVTQMQRLSEFNTDRRNLARRYHDELSNLPIRLPAELKNTKSAYHLYVIKLKLDLLNNTRKQVFEELRERGIGVNIHYIPVHTQPYYQALGFKYGDFPEAERFYDEAISLPIFHGMSYDQQDAIIEALKEILE